jgi:hypothetical protein
VPGLDPDRILALLRDPNVESQEIAGFTGVPREEAGRASRLLMNLARAKPEDVLSLPAPLAAAVGRAAASAGRTDLLAALAGHAAKEVAKEAKRGLHVLRARGVPVPDAPRPAPPAPAPAAEPALPAYATAVDGHGERAIWLPRNVPGKGIEVAQAVVSDVRGLLELQVGLLGRKEWRVFVKGLEERGAAMGLGEVSRPRAAALVVAARALNETSGARVPEGADLWLAQLGPTEPAPDPALAFAAPLPGDEERDAVAASAKLHDLPLLRGWLADEEVLRAVAAKLDEAAVSPLYLDERQRLEGMERVLADAVDTYFDEARRRRVAARLFAVAEHLAGRGDEQHARHAAAAGRALARGAPAASIPFARLLVEKAFPLRDGEASAAATGAQRGGLEAPGAPLIVSPR